MYYMFQNQCQVDEGILLKIYEFFDRNGLLFLNFKIWCFCDSGGSGFISYFYGFFIGRVYSLGVRRLLSESGLGDCYVFVRLQWFFGYILRSFQVVK